MIRNFSFGDNPSFLKAQALVRDELCAAIGADWPSVIESLATGKSLDLRGNFELMVQIENCLVDMLAGCGLSTIKSVQFPVNVRMSHATPPADYLSRPFATDYIHCDVWSGAPVDSMNVFLYLFTYGNCSSLKLFQSIEGDAYARQYRGPYSDYRGDSSLFREVPAPTGVGIMHAFSTYCPHQTVRGSDGLRISIDFRVRSEVPYLIDGAPADEVAFSSYSPGVPGPGIYWTKPEAAFRSFAEKCQFEMARAQELGTWAAALRESYIRKITTTGVFA
jgi:hypothetical protein